MFTSVALGVAARTRSTTTSGSSALNLGILVHRAFQKGQWDMCVKLMKGALKKKLVPPWSSYRYLLASAAAHAQWETCISIVDGISASHRSSRSLFRLLVGVETRCPEDIIRFLEVTVKRRLPVDDQMRDAAISQLRSKSAHKEVVRAWKMIGATNSVLHLVLDSACVCGMWDVAAKLWPRIHPNDRHSRAGIFLRCFIGNEKWLKALCLIHQDGDKHDPRAIGAAALLYQTVGLWEISFRLLTEIPKQHWSDDIIVSCYNEMPRRGWEHSLRIYNTLPEKTIAAKKALTHSLGEAQSEILVKLIDTETMRLCCSKIKLSLWELALASFLSLERITHDAADAFAVFLLSSSAPQRVLSAMIPKIAEKMDSEKVSHDFIYRLFDREVWSDALKLFSTKHTLDSILLCGQWRVGLSIAENQEQIEHIIASQKLWECAIAYAKTRNDQGESLRQFTIPFLVTCQRWDDVSCLLRHIGESITPLEKVILAHSEREAFCAKIVAFCEHAEWNAALRALTESNDRGVTPRACVYEQLLQLLYDNQKWNEISKVIDRFKISTSERLTFRRCHVVLGGSAYDDDDSLLSSQIVRDSLKSETVALDRLLAALREGKVFIWKDRALTHLIPSLLSYATVLTSTDQFLLSNAIATQLKGLVDVPLEAILKAFAPLITQREICCQLLKLLDTNEITPPNELIAKNVQLLCDSGISAEEIFKEVKYVDRWGVDANALEHLCRFFLTRQHWACALWCCEKIVLRRGTSSPEVQQLALVSSAGVHAVRQRRAHNLIQGSLDGFDWKSALVALEYSIRAGDTPESFLVPLFQKCPPSLCLALLHHMRERGLLSEKRRLELTVKMVTMEPFDTSSASSEFSTKYQRAPKHRWGTARVRKLSEMLSQCYDLRIVAERLQISPERLRVFLAHPGLQERIHRVNKFFRHRFSLDVAVIARWSTAIRFLSTKVVRLPVSESETGEFDLKKLLTFLNNNRKLVSLASAMDRERGVVIPIPPEALPKLLVKLCIYVGFEECNELWEEIARSVFHDAASAEQVRQFWVLHRQKIIDFSSLRWEPTIERELSLSLLKSEGLLPTKLLAAPWKSADDIAEYVRAFDFVLSPGEAFLNEDIHAISEFLPCLIKSGSSQDPSSCEEILSCVRLIQPHSAEDLTLCFQKCRSRMFDQYHSGLKYDAAAVIGPRLMRIRESRIPRRQNWEVALKTLRNQSYHSRLTTESISEFFANLLRVEGLQCKDAISACVHLLGENYASQWRTALAMAEENVKNHFVTRRVRHEALRACLVALLKHGEKLAPFDLSLQFSDLMQSHIFSHDSVLFEEATVAWVCLVEQQAHKALSPDHFATIVRSFRVSRK
jgi:hypothetical protein